ncbi:MAG: hypothetical protein ACXWQO_20070 [Bdellovibrionota bacterium]
MKKELLALIFLSAVLSGCVRSSSTVPEGTLPVYEHSGDVMGIPILEKRARSILIEGKIFMADPLEPLPKDLMLLLLDGETLVSGSRIEADGAFHFQGIFKLGTYTLRTMGERYFGETKVKVDSDKVSDIRLSLTRLKK